MSGAGRLRDRYGLPLSTSSPVAAEQYVLGLDRHLAWDLDAAQGFERALAVDDAFALAHAGLAVVRRFGGDAPGARESAARQSSMHQFSRLQDLIR